MTGVEVSNVNPNSSYSSVPVPGMLTLVEVCHRSRARGYQSIRQKGCYGSWVWPHASAPAIVWNRPQGPLETPRNQCCRRSSRVGKNFQDHAVGGTCMKPSRNPGPTFLVSKDYSVSPTNLATNTTLAAEMWNLYVTTRQGTIIRKPSICFNGS